LLRDRDLGVAMALVVAPELHGVALQADGEQVAPEAEIVDRDGLVLEGDRGVEHGEVGFLAPRERANGALQEAEDGHAHARGARETHDEVPPAELNHARPRPRSRASSPSAAAT